MSFLDTIFSPKTKPQTVETASTVLDRLRAERAEATNAIAAASEKRRALLRKDGTDAEIEKLEKEVARLELRLERLDEAEPVALAALSEARDVARAAEFRKLAKERTAAEADYAKAMRGAVKALADLVGVSNRMLAAGFAAEAASFPPPPLVVEENLLAQFERESFRAATLAASLPKPRAAISAPKAVAPVETPKAAPAAPKRDTSGAVRITDTATGASRYVQQALGERLVSEGKATHYVEPAAKPKAAAKPVDELPLPAHRLLSAPPTPDGEGMAHVIVLKAIGGDRPLKRNTIARLPFEDARALVQNGAAEFVAPPVETAGTEAAA